MQKSYICCQGDGCDRKSPKHAYVIYELSQSDRSFRDPTPGSGVQMELTLLSPRSSRHSQQIDV